MIINSIPPLSIQTEEAINQRKIHHKKKFISWDNGLEDLLSEPISSDLKIQKIKWKPSTRHSAKSMSIRVTSQFPETRNQKLESDEMIDHRALAKDREMRTRELMIKKIIQSPITPRKKVALPQTGSTHLRSRANTPLLDKREVETIIHTRNRRPLPADQKTIQKAEHLAVTRTFDFQMPSVVKSVMQRGKSSLY